MIMEDNMTHEQALEKAEWIDTLRDLGFVWDSNVTDQPNLSRWHHKDIGHLTVRLALITAESHPRCGHFAAMICIGLSHVMRPDIHLGAENTDELHKIYDIITSAKEES